MEEKEYIKFNVFEIKRMLKELLKLDYSKLSLTDSITLEHRLYYDIYAEWVKLLKGERKMKPITMYLLIALSLFVAGLPISIIVFVYATSELNKEHNDNQIIAIRIAQVISIILGVVCAVSIFS